MTRRYPIAIVLVSIGLQYACIMPLSDSGKDFQINDEYFVSWIDSPENRVIGANKDGSNAYAVILKPYVSAVGSTQDYIIAKQLASSGFPSFHVDTLSSNFYIIDISAGYPMHQILGPFSKREFDSTKVTLGIGGLPFEKEFPLR